MGALIGDLLPVAVGVAISPIPIIAVVLILLGRHARTASIGFAVGWLAGIIAATSLFVAIGGLIGPSSRSAVTAWSELILGILLLLLGVRNWRSRSAASASPKWMDAVDSFRIPAGLGIGFALAALNPKNLMLCIAAGVTIVNAELPGTETAIAIAVFAVLAGISVLGPVLAYQCAAARMAPALDALKKWLQANNQAVMAVLFLVLGFALLGKGLGGLL